MADGRMLKKAIANSKKLAAVSDRAKVLWFMMLPHADVEGRVKACPAIVKGQYLTMLSYSPAAIQKALEQLHRVGLIVLYEAEGNQYAEYTRYKDFQSLRLDREGESTIPPPGSGTTPGVLREDSGLSLSLSKVKLREEEESIFAHWNRQKETGRWKSHTKLTPDIREAIRENLTTWPADEIMQAISNFALVLQGREYLWTYDKWGLREFLTRHEKDNRRVQQWLRFHPNHFREEDWLTSQAKEARIQRRREKERKTQDKQKFIEEHRKWIMEADPAALIEHCKRDPRIRYAVQQLRPNIAIPENQ